MSEQTEQAVNPGQVIYEALSDEAKAAVDALPDDVFRGNEGQVAARVLGTAIQTCHEVGPAMWTILCDPIANGRKYVRLNVAMNNMVSWSDAAMRVIVDMGHDMPASLSEEIQRKRTQRRYKAENLIETEVEPPRLLEDSELVTVWRLTLQAQAEHDWVRNQ